MSPRKKLDAALARYGNYRENIGGVFKDRELRKRTQHEKRRMAFAINAYTNDTEHAGKLFGLELAQRLMPNIVRQILKGIVETGNVYGVSPEARQEIRKWLK